MHKSKVFRTFRKESESVARRRVTLPPSPRLALRSAPRTGSWFHSVDDDGTVDRQGADDADAEDRRIAFHEAGHAVVAFFSPDLQVRRVTIVWKYTIPGSTAVKILGEDDYEGTVILVDGPHSEIIARLRRDADPRLRQWQFGRFRAFARIRATLAGPIAEWRVASSPEDTFRPCARGFCHPDLEAAKKSASHLGLLPRGMERCLRARWRETEKVVTRYWPQIKAVVLALLREKTLHADRLREVILG